MESLRPQYLRQTASSNRAVNFARFSDFQRHHALPFVLRRDFYESGDSSGVYQHSDFLALYAVRGGRGVHRINDHPYGLVRGDIYLMAPGATHEFSHFENLELDCFFFQIGIFHAEELTALRELPGFWRLFAGEDDTEHRIHLAPEQWRRIETQIELMRQEWGMTSSAGSLRLKHEFFHLLVALARSLEESSQSRESANKEKKPDSGIAEALRFCEEHFDKPLSVPKLAARAFLSPGHFSELFVREVGMPPAAYVRRIRFEKARVLLRDSNLPVAEIAARCGFSKAAQFSRAFRNFYGDSPLEYRKKER